MDIGRCLERLNDRPRESILLAFLEGYSHEQVATPLGTVKSWIRRGLLR